jgi:hypothetical protein
MIDYIIGIGLLSNGAIYLKRELSPIDGPFHHLLLLIGSLSTLIIFISGFFFINWYAPLLEL